MLDFSLSWELVSCPWSQWGLPVICQHVIDWCGHLPILFWLFSAACLVAIFQELAAFRPPRLSGMTALGLTLSFDLKCLCYGEQQQCTRGWLCVWALVTEVEQIHGESPRDYTRNPMACLSDISDDLGLSTAANWAIRSRTDTPVFNLLLHWSVFCGQFARMCYRVSHVPESHLGRG